MQNKLPGPNRLQFRFWIAIAFSLLVSWGTAASSQEPAPESGTAVSGSRSSGANRPNVILIVTDDQGYGDVGFHGNPLLKTPNLDDLARHSVRLSNFHVDPTCSPTRSALLSGRYSSKTGVWHTICGRSLMATDELTLAEIFRANGYRTGMFGKWHLGDAYPLRPQDQGFDDVVCHGGGGVGQTPDYWDNDYFDDTYWRNGVAEPFRGYCTDVWFREATRFVRQSPGKPFFLYLATNAPHGPYLVDQKYAQPYKSAGEPTDKFLGMIANIDENLGQFLRMLRENELEDNTLLIFLTDNGTAQGQDVFNANMRGQKGSEFEGGHRVPFFVRWPAGNLAHGQEFDQLAAHIDLRPTLVELCGLDEPESGYPSDGASLGPILRGDREALRGRTLFVHSQRVLHAEKWRKSAVMTDRWRLINGTQLFDVRQDPGQKQDVAGTHASVVTGLRAAYEEWWQSLQPSLHRTVHVTIGSTVEPRTRLTAHDWLNPDSTPWHQGMVRRGPWSQGSWAVEVERPGRYAFQLARWPEELKQSIEAATATVIIQGHEATIPLDPTAASAEIILPLVAGKTRLQTVLREAAGNERGAFYTYVRRLAE